MITRKRFLKLATCSLEKTMKNILVIITALFVATVSGHPQGFIYPEDDGANVLNNGSNSGNDADATSALRNTTSLSG